VLHGSVIIDQKEYKRKQSWPVLRHSPDIRLEGQETMNRLRTAGL
jgi:ribosomal protein S13